MKQIYLSPGLNLNFVGNHYPQRSFFIFLKQAFDYEKNFLSRFFVFIISLRFRSKKLARVWKNRFGRPEVTILSV
jgi:hypothetical protein